MNIPLRRFTISCGLLSLLGLLLFVVGAITNESLTHAYLFWNLFLAWIPLFLALLIERHMTTNLKQPVLLAGLGFVWLLFLPNSFYMVTDYVHVTEVARVDPVFDSVMFSVVISTGFALGIASLLIVHRSLLKVVSQSYAQIIVGIVIAASSFAVYLGRELRFNSWDVITNPLQLTGDIVRIIVQPHHNLAAYITSLTFFIATTAIYAVVWYMLAMPAKKN